MDKDVLLPTYRFYDSTEDTWVIFNDVSGLLDYLRYFVEEMPDGTCVDYKIERHDMTQAEIDETPEM